MDAAKAQERGSSGAQSSEPDSGACENTEVRECDGATGTMDSGEAEEEEAEEDDDDLVAILSGLASSKPSKAARMGQRSSALERFSESVRGVLHLPLRQAAGQVNLGTTQFKLQCRKLGITRWPYRKLKGLATAIATCRAESGGSLPSLDGACGPAPALWAERLEALQDSLINRQKLGDILIPPEVKRVASWGVKRRHLQRQGRRLSSLARLGRAPWVAALETAEEVEVPRSARRGPARVPRQEAWALPAPGAQRAGAVC